MTNEQRKQTGIVSDFKVIMANPPNPNTEIWIAKDIVINCVARYNWFQKLMVRIVFGWKVKDL